MRTVGLLEGVAEDGKECFNMLLRHDHAQDLHLQLDARPLNIVSKTGVSRKAEILVLSDLTVQRTVVDALELQMIDGVNVVSEPL